MGDKVRVYELARELDKDNKSLEEAIRGLGIPIKNYMSTLSLDEAERVRAAFGNGSRPAARPAPSTAPRPSAPAPRPSAPQGGHAPRAAAPCGGAQGHQGGGQGGHPAAGGSSAAAAAAAAAAAGPQVIRRRADVVRKRREEEEAA